LIDRRDKGVTSSRSAIQRILPQRLLVSSVVHFGIEKAARLAPLVGECGWRLIVRVPIGAMKQILGTQNFCLLKKFIITDRSF
jgi:hypothetical protein